MSEKLTGKLILITGVSGFIGSLLMPALIKRGAKVIGVDYRKPDKGCCGFINDEINFFDGGIHKLPDDLKSYLDKTGEKITCVIHLAGMSDIHACQEDPLKAFRSNVELTVETLEICRQFDIRRYIFPSTALIYGYQSDSSPIPEDAEKKPENIYAATKLAAENMISGYAKMYSINAIICRLSNVYGVGHESYVHKNLKFWFPIKRSTILFDVLVQIFNGSSRIVIKNGNPVRDFIFIEDVISAIISLVELNSLERCKVFNISRGIGTSIFEFAQKLCEINHKPRSIVVSEEPISIAGPSLVTDNSALKKTGWHPEYSLDEGLRLVSKCMSRV